MIYKLHSFELLPWGATLKISCTTSSKEVNEINKSNYTSESTWIPIKQALGKNKSLFIESKKEPISMTYDVTSTNGDLVEIQTNLTCTSTKVNGIITKFTLDNTDWFNESFITENITIQRISTSSQVQLTEEAYSNLSFTRNGSTISSRDWISKGNRIYYFNVNGRYSNVPVGSSIIASYNYLKEITQKNLEVIEPSSGAVVLYTYIDHSPAQTITIYNRSKTRDVTRYSYFYDSQRKQYYYQFYKTYNEVSIGDKLDITYKYLELKEETLTTEEVLESIIHRGTISNSNKNKLIEDCIDNKNYFIIYKRDISEPEYIYLETDAYDNIQDGITVRFEKEKPYVKLCCNNVKIENCFNDAYVGFQNDFGKIDPAPSNNSKYICPCAKSTEQRAYFARYCTISWNKSEDNEVFYGDEKGNLYDRYAFTLLTDKGYKDEGTIDYHNQFNGTSYKNIVIPAIKNKINEQYCNTARLGFTVNFQGEDEWQPASKMYVKGGIATYTKDGYINNLSIGNHYISNDFYTGIPSLTTLEKWGGNENIFYLLEENNDNKYIYPADGIEIFTDWDDLCNCLGYVEPPCECEGSGGDGGGGDFPWKGRATGQYNVREEPNPNSTYIGGIGYYTPEHDQVMVYDEITNEHGHYYYISFRYSQGGDWITASGYVLAAGVEKYNWDDYIPTSQS